MDSTTDSGGNSPPDLVASTGVNDANSPWNGLLFSALQDGLTIGGSAVQTAIAQQTPLKGTAASNGTPAVGNVALAPQAAHHNYLSWAIGAAIVAVLAWFVLRKA